MTNDPRISEKLQVAACQIALQWHNPKANREYVEGLLTGMNTPVDIILLPEMFSTGFSMMPGEVAETMDGMTVQWMREVASRENALLAGSVIIEEKGHYYNRLIYAFPDGKMLHYDKRHLFSYAGEDAMYAAGSEVVEFMYKGWRIRGIICYDLRFPVWSRNTTGYDLLLCVANWPSPRVNAWSTLLPARAIENLCYTVGLNRIGTDANGLTYPGRTMFCDFLGNSMQSGGDSEGLIVQEIAYAPLQEFRRQYNFLADRDRFTIE